jgi:hypothetical protein
LKLFFDRVMFRGGGQCHLAQRTAPGCPSGAAAFDGLLR